MFVRAVLYYTKRIPWCCCLILSDTIILCNAWLATMVFVQFDFLLFVGPSLSCIWGVYIDTTHIHKVTNDEQTSCSRIDDYKRLLRRWMLMIADIECYSHVRVQHQPNNSNSNSNKNNNNNENLKWNKNRHAKHIQHRSCTVNNKRRLLRLSSDDGDKEEIITERERKNGGDRYTHIHTETHRSQRIFNFWKHIFTINLNENPRCLST